MKKGLILTGVILGFIIVWVLASMFAAEKFGGVGSGAVLLLGFIALPITIRLTTMKLFSSGKKKLDI